MANNEGIVISGGTVNARSLAVGRNASIVEGATAEANVSQLQELDLLLEKLRKDIEAHGAKLPQPAEAAQSVELVRNEVKQAPPNKLTIRSVMNGLKESLHSVVELAPLVESARELIEHVIK